MGIETGGGGAYTPTSKTGRDYVFAPPLPFFILFLETAD